MLSVSLKVAAVVGITFINTSGRRGGWGQKPKTEHKGLVLGCICPNAAKMGCCMNTATHCAVT